MEVYDLLKNKLGGRPIRLYKIWSPASLHDQATVEIAVQFGEKPEGPVEVYEIPLGKPVQK